MSRPDPGRDNTGFANGYQADRETEMAAYDSLSPCIRRALAGACVNIAAAYIVSECAGATDAAVVAMIEHTDRVYGSKTWRS